uniref:Uncharacterized protein n=1 Tax=Tetranychus urticae TaxID=32264 RepID=T1K215_TETUR
MWSSECGLTITKETVDGLSKGSRLLIDLFDYVYKAIGCRYSPDGGPEFGVKDCSVLLVSLYTGDAIPDAGADLSIGVTVVVEEDGEGALLVDVNVDADGEVALFGVTIQSTGILVY